MKKLNNKGFAISTLIYGLSIMGIMIVAILMATMAQTRSNNTSLAKAIEDDLNRFSKTDTTFKPTGNSMTEQQYIVPSSGWYKIELWGAQGGNTGGKGAYTGGVIELTEGDVLFFYVGKKRANVGGYASAVRVVEGGYTDFTSYETSIMVAAGGGANENASGGTLIGYGNKMISYGGFINSQGNNKNYDLLGTSSAGNNTNGTLVGFCSGYTESTATVPRVNVAPAPGGVNKGGDGYFASNSGDSGGSSFIAGYAGCLGYKKGVVTSNSRLEYYEHKYAESDGQQTSEYGNDRLDYYFVDGMMLAGVNEGDGFARIERVKEKESTDTKLIRKNTKLNNVKCIRSCNASGTTWKKILVSVNKGTTIERSGTSLQASGNCRIADLGAAYNIDELAIFHGVSGQDYKQDRISVSPDCSTWTDVKLYNSTMSNISETETPTGYRISAYQYDSTATLPSKGNYIIQPVLSENKVLTAADTSETNANPISIEYYKGTKTQKWSIELITDTKISPGYRAGVPSTYEYKIIELARYKALTITQDENMEFNTVSAINKFNTNGRNEPQIWKITPVGNGTYTISTVVASQSGNTGNLLPQTNSTVSDALNQVIIGKNNKSTARFKLIQVDYSSN